MSRDASDGNALYSGSASYREVEKLLYGRGRGLSIVSPYLSRYYIRKLAAIARRKRVRLITTSRTAREEHELRKYLSRGSHSIWLKAFAALFLFIALSLLAGSELIALMAAQVLAVDSMLLVVNAARRKHNIEVRFVKGVFVHEKIYISERQAITGSANLTWSGMHKNIEHLEMTSEPDRIRALSAHFQELWERAE